MKKWEKYEGINKKVLLIYAGLGIFAIYLFGSLVRLFNINQEKAMNYMTVCLFAILSIIVIDKFFLSFKNNVKYIYSLNKEKILELNILKIIFSIITIAFILLFSLSFATQKFLSNNLFNDKILLGLIFAMGFNLILSIIFIMNNKNQSFKDRIKNIIDSSYLFIAFALIQLNHSFSNEVIIYTTIFIVIFSLLVMFLDKTLFKKQIKINLFPNNQFIIYLF